MSKQNKPAKRGGLGRGLSSLMADVAEFGDGAAAEVKPIQQREPASEVSIPIELIKPNTAQPRRHFDDEPLADLAESIRAKGVIQPLILRKHPEDDALYQIVAGERRWRASQIAGLHELPAIIREFSDAEMLEVAIIENIQREDLNVVDEALSYQQLIDRFGHTQEQVAKGLGKSRSHIANTLRLLNLPDGVRDLLVQGKMSAGHARPLVGRDNAMELAQSIVKRGLSVRDAERLASKPKQNKRSKPPQKDADTRQIELDLAAQLNAGVEIKHAGEERGKIILSYKSLEQLDDLLALLSAG